MGDEDSVTAASLVARAGTVRLKRLKRSKHATVRMVLGYELGSFGVWSFRKKGCDDMVALNLQRGQI